MKRVWITTLITAAIVLAVFFRFRSMDKSMARDALTIGFLFEDDESTPYTYNFALTEEALLQQYPDKLTIYEMNNVSESDTEEPLADLIRKGCELLGMPVSEVAALCIEGMRPHAQELGLSGTGAV